MAPADNVVVVVVVVDDAASFCIGFVSIRFLRSQSVAVVVVVVVVVAGLGVAGSMRPDDWTRSIDATPFTDPISVDRLLSFYFPSETSRSEHIGNTAGHP